jgi:hypothetical protein
MSKKRKTNSVNPKARAAAMRSIPSAPNPHWDRLMSVEHHTMSTRIERTMAAQARDGLDGTFSREAMDDLNAEVINFIGTRIARYYDATGLMPQSMEVMLNVEVSA